MIQRLTTATTDGVEVREDGLLSYVCPAVATAANLERFFDDVARLTRGRAADMLVDVRPHQSLDATGRTVIYRRGPEFLRVRAGVVVGSRLQRAMVTFLALATRSRVRCFDTQQEALAWLTQ